MIGNLPARLGPLADDDPRRVVALAISRIDAPKATPTRPSGVFRDRPAAIGELSGDNMLDVIAAKGILLDTP
jgi:hypothetical protein